MYSSQVIDHFQNPRNVGVVANPDVKVRIENPACGDILELTVKIESGMFSEVRFRAKGCVSAMACSSLLTELTVGKTWAVAKMVSKEELVRKIGGLPPASSHAAQLAIDVLHALLEEVERGK